MSRSACSACRRRLSLGHGYPSQLFFFLFLFLIALVSALGACDGDNSGSPAARPSAGAASTSPTPSLMTVGGVQLLLYRGDGFSIGYPRDWRVTPAGSSVEFSHEADNASVSVQIVPNPNAATAPDDAIAASLDAIGKSGLYKNYKRVRLPSSVRVGGEIWQQQGATGEVQILSQRVNMEVIMLATNHPARSSQTRLFSIYMILPVARYQQLYMSALGPMLQSFRFLR